MKWYLACLILAFLALLGACTLPLPTLPGAPETGVVAPAMETQDQNPTSTPSAPAVSEAAGETPETADLQAVSVTATATQTPAPTPTSTPTPRFALQPGTPLGIANFVQPEAGCNWMGVGGQALDFSGSPITSLIVEVGGKLQDDDVFHLALSGSNPTLGPGGFVIQLATTPIASESTLWLQIKNLSGTSQSERVYFSTYADCEHNFILINFSELTASTYPRVFLPSIFQGTPLPH